MKPEPSPTLCDVLIDRLLTVYNWIKRYVGLMQKYLDKITPQVSPV
ncbi:MAG: hypothetical protein ABSG74_12580 [Candidatus Bathyarchaeia archaeon]